MRTPDARQLARARERFAAVRKCEERDLNPLWLGGNTRLFGGACVVTCHRVPSDGPRGPETPIPARPRPA